MTESASETPNDGLIGLDAAERLNRGCFCITLDRQMLATIFDQEVGVKGFASALEQSHPSLFSDAPVFIPTGVMSEMARVVEAVKAAVSLEGYREAALRWATPLAHRDFGPAGAMMGYDFHLTPKGAKLIEINTNAGGAFLNAPLARAQRACCAPTSFPVSSAADFGTEIAEMFLNEWSRQRGGGRPCRVAILDDAPETQYLLPEFKLAQALLQSRGIETLIGDPRDLVRHGNTVTLAGQSVDLIYNRLVDFVFEDPAHAILRDAYQDDAVVVTPNPFVYAMFADKRNLCLLSNNVQLANWGLAKDYLDVLANAALPTKLVTANNAEELWRERQDWFFKPARGHASKAVYRGDKLTRRVWGQIMQADYIAQAYAAPGLRGMRPDGERAELKMDVRLYCYEGRALLIAARLYRGQTTNMRTPGGGFAPVLVVP